MVSTVHVCIQSLQSIHSTVSTVYTVSTVSTVYTVYTLYTVNTSKSCASSGRFSSIFFTVVSLLLPSSLPLSVFLISARISHSPKVQILENVFLRYCQLYAQSARKLLVIYCREPSTASSPPPPSLTGSPRCVFYCPLNTLLLSFLYFFYLTIALWYYCPLNTPPFILPLVLMSLLLE